MTSLIITCARCFADYEPTHSDILAGVKHWRLCPTCRQSDAAERPTTDEPEREDAA